MKNTNSWIES